MTDGQYQAPRPAERRQLLERTTDGGNNGMPTLCLTKGEAQAVERVATEAMASGWSDDPAQQTALAVQAAEAIGMKVPRITEHLASVRDGEISAAVIKGLPAEQIIAPVVSLTLSNCMGSTFAYQEELDGQLAMKIVPKDNSLPNTNSTRDEFASHTDNAPVLPDYRCDFIALLGNKNPRLTLTYYSDLEHSLRAMSVEQCETLFEEIFEKRLPLSFGLGDDKWIGPLPILDQDDAGNVRIAYATYGTRLIDPTNRKAAQTLARLHALIERNKIHVALMPGTYLVFNNNRGLHSRSPIGPGDRLVYRNYIKPDLTALRLKCGMPGAFVFPLTKIL